MRGNLHKIMKYLVFGVVLLFRAVAEEVALIHCDKNVTCTNYSSLPNNTYCLESFCACPDENEQVRNCSGAAIVNVKDKPTVPLVGRTCKHDIDCNLDNGFCNTRRNQCECNKNYIPSNDSHKCLVGYQPYSTPCDFDKQCLGYPSSNITCLNNVCSCNKNYHFMDNACWKTVEFNESCTNNQECLLVNDAECNKQGGICACPVGKVINDKATKCLPIAQKFRAECSESIQCSNTFGDKSKCIDNICQCQENFHYVSTLKKCIANKALGEACTEDDECYQGEGEQKIFQCLEQRCACAKGFDLTGNTCTAGASTTTISVALVLSMIIYLSL